MTEYQATVSTVSRYCSHIASPSPDFLLDDDPFVNLRGPVHIRRALSSGDVDLAHFGRRDRNEKSFETGRCVERSHEGFVGQELYETAQWD